MAQLFDIQQIAASAYSTMQNLNNMATDLLGLDCMWCRLLPYENGEDVIVQEYTLHSYECPQKMKIICSNNTYNIGNFNIDLFGMHAESTLEIAVNLDTWRALYGENTMPQKGDFVYIQMMHRAYEVKSSAAVYTIGQQITSFKCVLGEWKHAASRAESEEFKVSIDELTVSQDRLFGDAISKEVADAVVEVETSFNETTYVDPLKEFDIESIKVDEVKGMNGNVIANAYYNFEEAKQNILYKVSGAYDPNAKEKHFIYTCWYKGSGTSDYADIKLGEIYRKEKSYWYFNIVPDMEVYEGMEICIQRGSIIKLYGTITTQDCDSGWVLKIPASECLKTSKKINNWWMSNLWKMERSSAVNLINLNSDDEHKLSISIDEKNIILNINGKKKEILIAKKMNPANWHYFAIDISNDYVRALLVENISKTKISKDKVVNDTTIEMQTSRFEFNNATIENKGNEVLMCNIRLYENEYDMEDTWKLDMYSQVTRNASKLILVDVPRSANKQTFITPVR